MTKLAIFALLLTFSSYTFSQSAPSILRQNGVEFSGGTIIADIKPEDLSTEVPRTIDFDEYMDYLFSQQIVVPGTLNINIGPTRKMISGRFFGTVLTPSSHYFQGIRGLSPATIKLGTNTTDPNAWSHIQVGTSNYGSSIWIQLHEDNEEMEISAYKNIQRDSLEPINPQRLGLQLKDSGNADVRIHENVYLKDGKVGIGTANPTAALEVVGNISLGGNKLLGKVGEVRSAVLPNTTTKIGTDGNFDVMANFTGITPFTASLKVFVTASITHRLLSFGETTTSFLQVIDVDGGNAVVATSSPLSFDFQAFHNPEVTYNHFLVFDAVAGRNYRYEILAKKTDFSGGTSSLGSGAETYSNKRIMLYAIPAN